MTIPSESYLKVQYELRPAKQVERRMIIDTLKKLSMVGFEIEDYVYVGLGSIYFVDYILFHKFLGIENMISAEHSTDIEKRVNFNKPYDFIKIYIKPIGEVIQTLSTDHKYFMWLDYDNIIDSDILEDVRLAATYLPVGSILLITVDSEPPTEEGNTPNNWMEYFQDCASDYIGFVKPEDFTKSNLPFTNAKILERVIKDGLVGRDVSFLPIFNFVYADGHQMVTIGGVLGTNTEKRKINGSKLGETSYVRRDLKTTGYRIRVPKVTRKERLYLDSAMPCSDEWEPNKFEMSKDDVLLYREIYRFFPAYAELLL